MTSFLFLCSLLISSSLISSCGNQAKKAPEEPVFDLITTEGTMRIKLYKETPAHRDNFAKLVAAHYYDGIIFHRIISGFMIQAGNTGNPPTAIQQQYGGPTGVNYTIPAEIKPGLIHKRGALGAARTDNPQKASSGSQFYIVHTDDGAKHLDGNYTVFGEVIDGFEIIDIIAKNSVNDSHPAKEVKIISIKPVL